MSRRIVMISQSFGRMAALLLACAAVVGNLAGCQPSPPISQAVAYPISLTLPKEVRIHSFTGTKVFGEGDKAVRGLEVHIEARDAYGDPTKAFGDFRFELYSFAPMSPDPKGNLITRWNVSLLEPKNNAVHWWNVSRTYVFQLRSDTPLKAGQQFVLVTTFSSPYTERLFAQRVFTAGQ